MAVTLGALRAHGFLFALPLVSNRAGAAAGIHCCCDLSLADGKSRMGRRVYRAAELITPRNVSGLLAAGPPCRPQACVLPQ
jgi:hypothetical protein